MVIVREAFFYHILTQLLKIIVLNAGAIAIDQCFCTIEEGILKIRMEII